MAQPTNDDLSLLARHQPTVYARTQGNAITTVISRETLERLVEFLFSAKVKR